jgi:inosine/xanthosine triphosphatase
MANGKIRVVVGSPNPVKISAVEEAFSKYFEVDVVSSEVGSGVKAFPDSEELIFQGALNRAKRAYSDSFDYSVGIEGGVVLFDGRWYDRNYVLVYDGKQTGVGTSASYEVPTHLVEEIDSETDESKKIIDRSLGVDDVFTKQGVIGLFKRGGIEKESLLTDAVVCAMTRLLNSEHYRDKRGI